MPRFAISLRKLSLIEELRPRVEGYVDPGMMTERRIPASVRRTLATYTSVRGHQGLKAVCLPRQVTLSCSVVLRYQSRHASNSADILSHSRRNDSDIVTRSLQEHSSCTAKQSASWVREMLREGSKSYYEQVSDLGMLAGHKFSLLYLKYCETPCRNQYEQRVPNNPLPSRQIKDPMRSPCVRHACT